MLQLPFKLVMHVCEWATIHDLLDWDASLKVHAAHWLVPVCGAGQRCQPCS